MAKVKPIRPEIPSLPCPPAVLNWNATLGDDPKTLARLARAAATLAHLVTAGLEAENHGDGQTTDFEASLGRECTALTEAFCFRLAQQLGALEEE